MTEAAAIATQATQATAAQATEAAESHVDASAPNDAHATTDGETAKLWSNPKAEAEEAEAHKDVSPDWFMKDKYKTIEDQAKARFDLEKLMGKNWGAPRDDYKIDGIEGINVNDPLLEHLKPALKELGLSQNGFSTLVKSYQDANIAMSKRIEAEVAETLTKSDAQTVTTVDKWLNESFTPEDRETIQSWIMSVNDFKLLNTLRTMIPSTSSVPSSLAGNAAKFESTKELDNEKIKYRKEVSTGHRVADKNFENDLQQRWRDAFTREEHVKRK